MEMEERERERPCAPNLSLSPPGSEDETDPPPAAASSPAGRPRALSTLRGVAASLKRRRADSAGLLGPSWARGGVGPLRRLRAIEDRREEGGVLPALFREDGATIRARVQVHQGGIAASRYWQGLRENGTGERLHGGRDIYGVGIVRFGVHTQ